MLQPIVLCADDYALSPAVSRGILDLIEHGRLSATGCMTVSPYWSALAPALRELAGRVDVGLHLTLTDHRPLGVMPHLAPEGRLPPLGTLLFQAMTGRLDALEINAEVTRQVAVFMAVFGAPPAFIDGHQHVHVLPVVRHAVIATVRALPGTWLRNCHEPLRDTVARGVATAKTLLIGQLGRGLHTLIEQHRLPTNGAFRGVYDLSPRRPFAELMERFLEPPFGSDTTRPPLIMVHPGFVDDALRRIDPVTEQRRVEYDYLRSDRFGDLLATRNQRVARFGATG